MCPESRRRAVARRAVEGILEWCAAIVAGVWVLILVFGVFRLGWERVAARIPNWLLYISWIGVFAWTSVLLPPLKRGIRNMFRKDQIIGLLGPVALIVGSVYVSCSVFAVRRQQEHLKSTITEAVTLAYTSPVPDSAASPRIPRAACLLTVDISAPPEDRKLLGDRAFVAEAGGMFASSALGDIPRHREQIEWVVVVERTERVVGRYTHSASYQWVFRVTVIDWGRRRVEAVRTFEGEKPGTPDFKVDGGGSDYGEEPWDAIRSWLMEG